MDRPSQASRPAAQKALQHRTIAAAWQRICAAGSSMGISRPASICGRMRSPTEFGVSRIPVREALMQLEAEGLVKIHPHRGAIVSELSTEEVEELFELSALLEPRLLKASARN